MRLSAAVDPDVVEAFLEARIRETEHLDYRSKVDPGGDRAGARKRLAETVAAMANTGGTGLILVGVSEDAQGDRPDKWWLLTPGELREQTIEALCHELEPYVPVEIGRSVRDGGEVVIIRVPDFWHKPVFLRDRGILVRHGQANVPASPAEIRTWLAPSARSVSSPSLSSPSFMYNFLDLLNKESPVMNLGVTPARAWPYQRWSDETDDALMSIGRQLFPDLGEIHVGEGIIRFGKEPTVEVPRSFTVSSAAEVFRASCPDAIRIGGECNAMTIGIEVAKTWAFARAALPIVLPRFAGPATLRLSIGGVTAGFGFVITQETMHIAHDVERSALGHRDSWRKEWPDLTFGSSPADVADVVLSEMLRAFGYRLTRRWVAFVRRACENLPDVAVEPA